jgi:hypothetical protein
MGSLIGGGLGGLGAGGLQYYGESSPERGAKVDAGIDYLGGLFNKGIGALGLGQGVQNLPGFNRPAPAGGEGAI